MRKTVLTSSATTGFLGNVTSLEVLNNNMKILLLPNYLRRMVLFFCLFPAIAFLGIYIVVSISFLPIAFFLAPFSSLKKSPSRHLRFSLMGMWYLLMEVIGVLVAFILWVGTIFGYFLDSKISHQIHASVQYFWTSLILFGARVFLNATVVFPSSDVFHSGPLIVASQHSSFFDALIPTVLLGKGGGKIIPRHVLKNDLLLSPSLDIYGNRLPNIFVTRKASNSGIDISGIKSLATDLGNNACVIFPEGTFYSKKAFSRSIEKIELVDPERAALLSALKHLLPIKPGGILGLLNSAPKADLVLVSHFGFKPFGSFKSIMENIPFKTPIEILVKRIPSSSLPLKDSDCLNYIDAEWLYIDRWLQSKVEEHDSRN